jgi:hypothetical protein
MAKAYTLIQRSWDLIITDSQLKRLGRRQKNLQNQDPMQLAGGSKGPSAFKSAKVKVPKTEVSNYGWFAICTDTENNTFGLWEAKEG